jgi:very-short-patch-repair endonuclease
MKYHPSVEVEGLSWHGVSRHTTPKGYRADLEKYNAATLQGWRVLRFEQDAIKNGTALQQIINLLGQEEARQCAKSS